MRATVLAMFLLLAPAMALLTKPAANDVKPAANATTPSDGPQIEQLRAKLTKITASLKFLVAAQGSLSKMDVGSTVQAFYASTQVVLKDTQGKTDAKSLKALQDAMKNVKDVVKGLTSKQLQLTLENEAQEDSLLLGVLMGKQHEGMDAQLAVLKSEDFAKLTVTKALLANKDMKTPLFQQVAAYLDAHTAHDAKGAPINVTVGKPDMTDVISNLQARLHKLENSSAHAKLMHAKTEKSMDEAEKKNEKDKRKKSLIHMLRKKEDRKFAKMMAIEGKDTQSMKDAIAALQSGDIKALQRAEASLDSSVKAMQSHNGGFLVLVQQTLREAGMDCPFCAAQCVDKCHNEGKPYVTCLTDCADAGK